MSWTPRELDLAGFILVKQREAERLERAGDVELADELHRELWDARHELRKIREASRIEK